MVLTRRRSDSLAVQPRIVRARRERDQRGGGPATQGWQDFATASLANEFVRSVLDPQRQRLPLLALVHGRQHAQLAQEVLHSAASRPG